MSILRIRSKLLFATLLVASSFASADILIDDFNTQSQLVTDLTSGVVGVADQSDFSANIIGGYRDIYVNKVADPLTDGVLGIRSSVVAGSYGFSSDTGQSGLGILRWDGDQALTVDAMTGAINDVDFSGLGGIDFSGLDGFLLTVISSDANFIFRLEVYDTLGNLAFFNALANSVIDDGTPEVFFIPFAIFSGDLNVFTDVGALQAIINATNVVDIDLRIDSASAVPEPGTLAMFGLGLLGLAGIRRRHSD